MNVVFQESNPKPALIEDVIVGGVKIGTVQLSDMTHMLERYRFHTKLQLEGLEGPHGFLQGFGASKEDAIKDAVESSRRKALNLLEKLDEFDLKLFVA